MSKSRKAARLAQVARPVLAVLSCLIVLPALACTSPEPPRVEECSRAAAPSPGGPAPTVPPGGGALAICAGVATMMVKAPPEASPGKVVKVSVRFRNESAEERSLRYLLKLGNSEHRIFAQREYPPIQVASGEEDHRELELPLPADLPPGDYSLDVETSLFIRVGRSVEPFQSGTRLRIVAPSKQ